ncbi:MAG: pyrroline-5-carboxylate reductase [Pseudolabrys sp.]|nr:pyrroline-5-carboxylate reductase [Pseudolabrys sp.]MDP2298243.1 pyrroline-5-carboxylate reductase [Pseudolabrys sp.]
MKKPAKKPLKKSTDAKVLAAFPGRLVLVGAGKMGGAMLDGWTARGLKARQVIVIDPMAAKGIKALAKRGLALNPKPGPSAKADAAAIVIAVKPQTAPEAIPPLGLYVGKSTLVISIMAGRTIGFLENILPPGTAIVRAMPNTPAAIGRGITVAVPNAKVSARQRRLATELLAATGSVEWVKDEKLIDAVTATSGSGPAYVFLLVEAMTKAAIAAGLPTELAGRLARETVAGSGELLHRSDLDAATLRQNVTSPGGTTAAALAVLMGPAGLDDLMTRAIAAATNRSRELAG